MHQALAIQLTSARDRLLSRGLFSYAGASLSLRLPGSGEYLLLDASVASPIVQSLPPAAIPAGENAASGHTAQTHSLIYRIRSDVGAIAIGGGPFGSLLHAMGGTLPMLFDEQARHLGRMRGPVPNSREGEFERNLTSALSAGTNAVVVANAPTILGTSCQRMVLNAELFEKCAKAHVLAAATGNQVTRLPWWVIKIAGDRLKKDQRRARQCFANGKLPPESSGY